MHYEINGNWGVCFGIFRRGGVFLVLGWFFLHLNIFKQQNKDYLLKREKYFCVTYPEYVIMIKYSDMCFHKQYYNITETYIA